MLSKPYADWTTLTYKDFSESISYLDDIPMIWLKAFKIYLEHIAKECLQDICPLHITGDCEGYNVHIVVDKYSITLYTNEDGEQIYLDFDIDYLDFIERICQDFENNIEDWAKWAVFEIDKEEILLASQERKIKILEDISIVRRLVKEIRDEEARLWEEREKRFKELYNETRII